MMSTSAYPKGVGHCRQKSDQTTSNGPPSEDTLLALGIVEEGLKCLLNERQPTYSVTFCLAIAICVLGWAACVLSNRTE